MIKVELEPFEVQLAFENSTKRYIENLKQGKTFSYGYFGGFEKTITDGNLSLYILRNYQNKNHYKIYSIL